MVLTFIGAVITFGIIKGELRLKIAYSLVVFSVSFFMLLVTAGVASNLGENSAHLKVQNENIRITDPFFLKQAD